MWNSPDYLYGAFGRGGFTFVYLDEWSDLGRCLLSDNEERFPYE